MEKEVHIKYPRLRKKVEGSKLRFGVTEPIRKTLYDIFMENLKKLDRVTYLHRLVYAGKHKSPDELLVIFRNTIKVVNDEYCREKLTGFLLIYNTSFVHVVEGSEDGIGKHLGILLETPEYSECIREMKLLIQISNVLKRLCPEWMIYNGTPPELISTLLDKRASVEDTAHALYKCLRQTYETVKMFVANNYDDTLSKVSFEHNSKMKMSHGVSLFPHSKDDTSLQDQAKAIDQHLPEMELIEALIESPYTQTIERYYDLFLDVPQSVVDNDKVWPIPCDCVPYDIFSSIYDNVTELTGRQDDSKQKSQEELSEETDKDHSAMNKDEKDYRS